MRHQHVYREVRRTTPHLCVARTSIALNQPQQPGCGNFDLFLPVLGRARSCGGQLGSVCPITRYPRDKERKNRPAPVSQVTPTRCHGSPRRLCSQLGVRIRLDLTDKPVELAALAFELVGQPRPLFVYGCGLLNKLRHLAHESLCGQRRCDYRRQVSFGGHSLFARIGVILEALRATAAHQDLPEALAKRWQGHGTANGTAMAQPSAGRARAPWPTDALAWAVKQGRPQDLPRPRPLKVATMPIMPPARRRWRPSACAHASAARAQEPGS